MMIVLKLSFIVERKFRGLYENGWFEGCIEYFNKNIFKYHVSFNESSEDYIDVDDIDMIEAIVL